MFDLVIKNGSIIDGTGSPAYRADVAIKDGKIAAISECIQEVEQIIDATGLTVTPGFIDSHSHSDSAVLTFPDQKEKIEQGVTTSIAGQCGTSVAPISRDADPKTATKIADFGKSTDVYKTMGTFLNVAKNVPLGSNVVLLVGHGSLRMAVMGQEDRAPTEEELGKMKWYLREAMEHGAIGISFGTFYAPGCFAEKEELIALAKVVGEYHGVAAAHLRSEGDWLIESAQEFIDVVRASGVRGIHSHHKAANKKNWGKVKETLRMLDEANEQGIEMYSDVYPYTAGHTSLSVHFIPKEYRGGGTPAIIAALRDPQKRAALKAIAMDLWSTDELFSLMITKCETFPEYKGKRLPEAAAMHGKDTFETAFDILVQSNNTCTVCKFAMCEEDLETIMCHPKVMICTDAGVAGNQTLYHPRMRGSFPRVLGRYVRERKVTSLPAEVYSLQGKGLIREGFDADLCIFDAEKIIDHADFTHCKDGAEGLNYVILGGEVVVEDAAFNGKRKSKVILR